MKLAVFTKNLSNPAYAAARLGAERAAALFDAQVQHYVPTVPDDPVQQCALIDEALAAHPDAFVFTPVHATRVQPAIDRIHAAGLPIFAFVNRMAPGQCVSYAGSSDGQLATDVAVRLIEHLGGHGHVAIVEGPPDSVTSIERVRAFERVIAAFPQVRLVGRCHGGYQREPARQMFGTVLASVARIDAVLAANDIMAIGVLDALRAADRRALVVGVNAIPQAIDAIARGDMLATADFNAMQMCFLATECAIRHLRGEPVPAEIDLPVEIVDASNWQRWAADYAQRSLLTLKEIP